MKKADTDSNSESLIRSVRVSRNYNACGGRWVGWSVATPNGAWWSFSQLRVPVTSYQLPKEKVNGTELKRNEYWTATAVRRSLGRNVKIFPREVRSARRASRERRLKPLNGILFCCCLLLLVGPAAWDPYRFNCVPVLHLPPHCPTVTWVCKSFWRSKSHSQLKPLGTNRLLWTAAGWQDDSRGGGGKSATNVCSSN